MRAVMRLHVVMYRGLYQAYRGVRRALFSGVGTHRKAREFTVNEKVLETVVGTERRKRVANRNEEHVKKLVFVT